LLEEKHWDELRRLLRLEGYLFLRGLIPRAAALAARDAALTQAAADGAIAHLDDIIARK